MRVQDAMQTMTAQARRERDRHLLSARHKVSAAEDMLRAALILLDQAQSEASEAARVYGLSREALHAARECATALACAQPSVDLDLVQDALQCLEAAILCPID